MLKSATMVFCTGAIETVSDETIVSALGYLAGQHKSARIGRLLSVALTLCLGAIDGDTVRYNARDNTAELVDSLDELLDCARRIGNDDLAMILDAVHKLAFVAYFQQKRGESQRNGIAKTKRNPK